ncbi:hypothetical protein IKQ74_00775 [Candidatus Saccharibacteria bacterium]|nr:hypothetical protein [Candidatus Saccharibacteria bacterium]
MAQVIRFDPKNRQRRSSRTKNKTVLGFPRSSAYGEEDMATLQSRAYQWAKSEQEEFCPEARKINLHKLSEAPDTYGRHLSFFTNGSHVLARYYWPFEGKVLYYDIQNFPQIEAETPEIAKRLLLNGVYAYTRENSKKSVSARL